MTKFVNEEFELDENTIKKIEDIANEHNATIDEVINYILQLYISKKVTITDFIQILADEKYDDGELPQYKWPDYYIILDEHDKPVARVIPIEE